jgi:hypothetical protein
MYMAPVAVVALIPTTLIFEPDAASLAMKLGQDGTFWGLLFLNSFLAYFVNLTNFLVTKHTSALTLQVLGNAKGVVAVVLSLIYFRNPVNFYSVFGYAITVTGVVMYSQAKKAAKKQQLLLRISSGEQAAAANEAVLINMAQQQQQNGHGHGLAVNGGAKDASAAGMADAVALLRAAEKLGNNGYLSFNIPADGSMRGEREPLMAMSQARPALVQAAPSFSRGYSTFFDA